MKKKQKEKRDDDDDKRIVSTVLEWYCCWHDPLCLLLLWLCNARRTRKKIIKASLIVLVSLSLSISFSFPLTFFHVSNVRVQGRVGKFKGCRWIDHIEGRCGNIYWWPQWQLAPCNVLNGNDETCRFILLEHCHYSTWYLWASLQWRTNCSES